jgi:hypothetical protein
MKKQEKPHIAQNRRHHAKIEPLAAENVEIETIPAIAAFTLAINKENKSEMLDRILGSTNTPLAVSAAFLSSEPCTQTAVALRKMCKIHQGIYSLIAAIKNIGIRSN